MHIVGQERHVLFQFRHVLNPMFVGTSTAPLKIHAHALVDFALGSCFKTPFDSEIIALYVPTTAWKHGIWRQGRSVVTIVDASTIVLLERITACQLFSLKTNPYSLFYSAVGGTV
jgi:hypothetical protein